MIPFNNLKPIFQQYAAELRGATRRVMQSGVYLMGSELDSFEKEFSRFIGSGHAIGVGSGTDALALAIHALGLKNQEVLVPANAYPTAFGVVRSGAKMRLCDVQHDTLNVSVPTIKQALTSKTRGIVVVHLYGMPAPMAEIIEFSKKNKLIVIEDCAQATGAYIRDRHVGMFGDIGCFSFYPTKNLGAMGDGGMIVTRDQRIARTVKRLRVYGEDIRYHSLEASTNSRLDEIQCAVLRVRLKYLKRSLQQRDNLANRYRLLVPSWLQVPKKLPDGIHHASHLFVVQTERRDELKNFFLKKEIETMIHYPSPIHLQPAFSYLGNKKGSFPISEQACRQVLSLPMYLGLKKKQQDFVIETVNVFSRKYGHS